MCTKCTTLETLETFVGIFHHWFGFINTPEDDVTAHMFILCACLLSMFWYLRFNMYVLYMQKILSLDRIIGDCMVPSIDRYKYFKTVLRFYFTQPFIREKENVPWTSLTIITLIFHYAAIAVVATIHTNLYEIQLQ